MKEETFLNHIEYFIENLDLKRKIPLLAADSDQKHLTGYSKIFQEEAFFQENDSLLHQLCERALRQEYPVLYLEEKVFCYAILRDDVSHTFWVIGPVLLGQVSRNQLWQYRGITKFFTKENRPPLLSLSTLLRILHLLYFSVKGKQMDQSAFLQENNIAQSELPQIKPEDLVRLQLASEPEAESHHTYLEEQSLWDNVKRGLSFEEIFSKDPGIHSGRLAKDSFKQEEYLCVTSIALLTRVAIESGLPPSIAYGLSDLALQKLEKCSNQIAIRNLMESVWQTFLTATHDSRQVSTVPSYISACKNYIATHRTQPIRVAELAKIAGISHSYLSKQFREYEGMTLQQYILKEKVDAAANMLRYSTFSISEIADYLSFTSQSHLGQCFKKEYHMTLREYREKYRVREFS